MGILSWAKSKLSRSSESKRGFVRVVNASYDAAQTTPNNANHWAAADSLDANAANNSSVRKDLRNRSRYEVANNTYARGIIDTFANDIIGSGPRLQIQTRSEDFNQFVERNYRDWADEIELYEKLLMARKAMAESGEVFIVMTSNPALQNSVKLDLAVIEAEQVADPTGMAIESTSSYVDGIHFDEFGNVTGYDVLNKHPGGDEHAFSFNDFETVPARFVIHLFKKTD